MLKKRWRLLALGGGIAALLVVVGVEAATPTPAASPGNPAQVFIDKLAGILGISSQKTAADVKQAELQTIDQMVKDGKITQAQGDAMKQKINNNATPSLGIPGFGRFGEARPDRAVMMNLMQAEANAAAKALKTTPTDLRSSLRSGKTLADLEKTAGVSDTDFRKALKDAAKGVLDPAVKAGTVTQQMEDNVLNAITNGQLPFGRFGGFGHRGWGGPMGAPGGPGGPAGAPPGATPQGYSY